ncbi:type VII secretion integral membrane protein EccD [Propionibacterium sp. oral taxon 192 str. F0372]|uniref:type VII secretion integral membrane protein EccD n=1 Tax=Propionibacterium sp. oral taxon 192 TaxID=671222 RepID=UPI000353DD89|nr:type VII secretion integral membrane protein EccD [Propionibacterium sp. oral taxon 192]EPH05631.1 type VII secretion integral membrane protein EccD [Propionibacterium sp. oral taxon 192 str. F0372]
MSAADEDLARVTVISPTRRVDLALPGNVTLGELLPSVVRFSGYEGGTPQEAVHGWVLQRFGHDPLDPNVQVSRLNIRDGETLYLRQREAALPDAAFDDVVDAVSSTTAKRPAWQPKHSRSFTIGALITALVGVPTGAMMLQAVQQPVGNRGYWGATAALILALAAAIASIALSRAAGRYRVSAALAWSAVALAGIGGFQLLDRPELPVKLVFTSALLLGMSAACALAAAVTQMALFSVAAASGCLLVASVIAALNPSWTVQSAGVGVAVLLATTAMMPTWSYRIAQIHLPALPNTADDILADEEPVQPDIVSRAVFADRLLAAMLTAACIDIVLFCLLLLPHGGGWHVGLATCAGLALMMRARAFVGFSQRLVLLSSGTLVTMISAIGWLAWMPTSPILHALLIVVVLSGGAVALTHYAAVGYAKILSPTFGRWGDIVEWLAVMAVFPLTLGVIGTYGWVQTLFTGAR